MESAVGFIWSNPELEQRISEACNGKLEVHLPRYESYRGNRLLRMSLRLPDPAQYHLHHFNQFIARLTKGLRPESGVSVQPIAIAPTGTFLTSGRVIVSGKEDIVLFFVLGPLAMFAREML